MEINIYVDIGPNYRVALTPKDARKLFNELHELFDPLPYTTPSVDPGFWKVSSTETNVNKTTSDLGVISTDTCRDYR